MVLCYATGDRGGAGHRVERSVVILLVALGTAARRIEAHRLGVRHRVTYSLVVCVWVRVRRLGHEVLHALLEPDYPKDRPDLGFVGISNWALDPAKMNRGVFLFRPTPTLQDLTDTAVAIQKGWGDRVREEVAIPRNIFEHVVESPSKFSHNVRTVSSLV